MEILLFSKNKKPSSHDACYCFQSVDASHRLSIHFFFSWSVERSSVRPLSLASFVNNNNNNMAARRAENRSVKDSIEAINSVLHNHTGFRIFHRYVDRSCAHQWKLFFVYRVRQIRKSIFIRDDAREKIKFNYIKNRGKHANKYNSVNQDMSLCVFWADSQRRIFES